MYNTVFESTDELIKVQDEPELEFALPQVFEQPPLSVLRRGKLANVEELAAKIYQHSLTPQGAIGLGPDYQALVNEFQPLFTWTIACWDYLLSTEGCRFVPRNADEKASARGDYRVITDKDYSRLVHRLFRQCVLEFAHGAPRAHSWQPLDPLRGATSRTPAEAEPARRDEPILQSLSSYVRSRLWDEIVQAYRKLEEPPDPRQRNLTAYSYLRCVPYHFLNRYHHELVTRTLHALPEAQRRVTEEYFFKFFTLPATAESLALPFEPVEELLRQGLVSLLLNHRLVYCLLRQIERY